MPGRNESMDATAGLAFSIDARGAVCKASFHLWKMSRLGESSTFFRFSSGRTKQKVQYKAMANDEPASVRSKTGVQAAKLVRRYDNDRPSAAVMPTPKARLTG